MSEVTQSSVVSKENYAEVKKMLLSKDEGSVQLGLSIMEQAEYEKSEVFILAMMKETFDEIYGKNGPYTKFKDTYTELYDKVVSRLSDEDTDIANLSHRKIYELAIRNKSREQVEFLLEVFNQELKKLLVQYGFTFLEYLDLSVKPKEEPVYENE